MAVKHKLEQLNPAASFADLAERKRIFRFGSTAGGLFAYFFDCRKKYEPGRLEARLEVLNSIKTKLLSSIQEVTFEIL